MTEPLDRIWLSLAIGAASGLAGGLVALIANFMIPKGRRKRDAEIPAPNSYDSSLVMVQLALAEFRSEIETVNRASSSTASETLGLLTTLDAKMDSLVLKVESALPSANRPLTDGSRPARDGGLGLPGAPNSLSSAAGSAPVSASMLVEAFNRQAKFAIFEPGFVQGAEEARYEGGDLLVAPGGPLLLFKTGEDQAALFPGRAYIENWERVYKAAGGMKAHEELDFVFELGASSTLYLEHPARATMTDGKWLITRRGKLWGLSL